MIRLLRGPIVCLTCAMLALATTTRAAAPDADLVQKDQELLRGTWTLTSGAADGQAFPETMLPGFKRVCDGNEVTVTNGDQLIMKARVTIDPGKSPKTIDYEVIDGPTKGKKHLGIYEVTSGMMRSCFAAPDMERPTEFASKPGDRCVFSTWIKGEK